MTESGLKPTHNIPNVPGYFTYRFDKKRREDCGIICFVSEKYKSWNLKIDFDSMESTTEIGVIKIQHEFMKSITIVCVYRHPRYIKSHLSTDISFITEVISKLKSNNNEMILFETLTLGEVF